jgi:hypothetical protein
MNVERTIEFILKMQAKSEARAERSEARADKFDKRLEATRKLVETGLKLLVKIEKSHQETKKDFDRRLKELIEAQKRTDQKLDRLIDFWGKQRSNGHQH